ncbi:MAG: polyprenyl synthetase family protein [Prevotella sp.]|nr:polyprenyl synthetase family protein [Prevotella sp.]MBQ8702672.1 polyprenyl synthetase family protein [Prevotella sp.]
MNFLSTIKQPIEVEYNDFVNLFNESLQSDDKLLGMVLSHIRNRGGKRMRPLLVLLTAKAYGEVNGATQNAAIGVELLHTASLVHDDVVDESNERRGQPSVNAVYNNKVSVLVGDYLLSTSMLHFSKTLNWQIIETLAKLCQTLSSGEVLQLENIQNTEVSEDIYYQIIHKKTASLFETCCEVGALSVGASEKDVETARQFGYSLGMIFQIRDDIFDYYDCKEIGKPTGNDMAEGKLTLPIIHAFKDCQDESIKNLVGKVKSRSVTTDEIATLVEFTKRGGGIEYSYRKMDEFAQTARLYLKGIQKQAIREALTAYLDFVSLRTV